MNAPPGRSVHATAVVVGERGVLLRGASGAGKSLLALALIERQRRSGAYAALIGDDRVWLSAHGGRLVARGAASTAGLCERRAFGLVRAPHAEEAVVRLVVDLAGPGETPPRMPQRDSLYVKICEVRVPRLALDMAPGLDHGASAVLAGLAEASDEGWRKIVGDDEVFA